MSKAETSQGQRNLPSGFMIAHFGGCPECGGTDGIVNIGPSHWPRCDQHKVTWCVGSNLFSEWRDQTEDEQRKIYDDIGMEEYREISCEEAHTHPLVRQWMLNELMAKIKWNLDELTKDTEWVLDELMKQSGGIAEVPGPDDPPF